MFVGFVVVCWLIVLFYFLILFVCFAALGFGFDDCLGLCVIMVWCCIALLPEFSGCCALLLVAFGLVFCLLCCLLCSL